MIKEFTRRGEEIPAAYLKPIVPDGLQIFLNAWRELNLERNEGGNFVQVLRITRNQITQWLNDNGKLNDYCFCEELRNHVFALDNVFIPFEKDRRSKELAKARAKDKANAKANAKKFR